MFGENGKGTTCRIIGEGQQSQFSPGSRCTPQWGQNEAKTDFNIQSTLKSVLGDIGIAGQSGYFHPVLLHPQTSKAFAGGKRRNSHQSAVFGKAGNGTVVRIFELEWSDNPDILNSQTNLVISAPDY